MKYFIIAIATSLSLSFAPLGLGSGPLHGDDPEGFSVSSYWDLSYQSLLEQFDIRWDYSDGTLYTWLENDPKEQQHIRDFLERPLNEKVVSSFLIEHPTLPDGGRLTVWGIQTENESFFWVRSSKKGPHEFQKRKLTTQEYDQVFNQLINLKQKSTFDIQQADHSFAGFLSTYQHEKSNQILLHVSDFLEIDPISDETIGWGTIYQLEANVLEVKF